jgi:hypothetical protein
MRRMFLWELLSGPSISKKLLPWYIKKMCSLKRSTSSSEVAHTCIVHVLFVFCQTHTENLKRSVSCTPSNSHIDIYLFENEWLLSLYVVWTCSKVKQIKGFFTPLHTVYSKYCSYNIFYCACVSNVRPLELLLMSTTQIYSL